jgi:hypothetical protein
MYYLKKKVYPRVRTRGLRITIFDVAVIASGNLYARS